MAPNKPNKTPKSSAKKQMAEEPGTKPQGCVDFRGQSTWALSKSKCVTISSFKGAPLIHVREYYEKNGLLMPGKKGIHMTVAEFGVMVACIEEVMAAVDGME